GEYRISRVEMSFGKERDDLGEVILTSNEGRRIELRGKIDGIDAYNTGGDAYINMIDYKSSTRCISRTGILNGLELQMITYMYVLTEEGNAVFEGEIKHSSMLVLQDKDPVLNLKEEKDREDIIKEQNKQLRPDGAFINEHPSFNEYLDGTSVGLSGLLSDFENYTEYGEYYP